MEQQFEEFCVANFITDTDTLDMVFNKLMLKFEALIGSNAWCG